MRTFVLFNVLFNVLLVFSAHGAEISFQQKLDSLLKCLIDKSEKSSSCIEMQKFSKFLPGTIKASVKQGAGVNIEVTRNVPFLTEYHSFGYKKVYKSYGMETFGLKIYKDNRKKFKFLIIEYSCGTAGCSQSSEFTHVEKKIDPNNW